MIIAVLDCANYFYSSTILEDNLEISVIPNLLLLLAFNPQDFSGMLIQ